MTVGSAFPSSSLAQPAMVVAEQKVGNVDESAHGPLRQELLKRFGKPFTILDSAGRILSRASSEPVGDDLLCEAIVESGITEPKLIAEEDHVCILAIPIQQYAFGNFTAITPFATHSLGGRCATAADARMLGLEVEQATRWLQSQSVWPTDALLRMASTVSELLENADKLRRMEVDMEKVSDNLASTYEEISLLYGVTQNVRLSRSDEELGQLALSWMMDCMAVEGVAIQFLPVEDDSVNYLARTEKKLITDGEAPVTNSEFSRLIEHLDLAAGSGPCVVNAPVTGKENWPSPAVRQMIVAPLNEGPNLFGWLAAFNSTEGQELGTVEASLISSVAAILGIHSGNHELYRQQNEFLGSVVHAMTSAIDAKDPYTCGHSDRVARVSVALAQQMGYDIRSLNRIYMAGLLHDVGKIGINDNVLRKPDKLTDEEFEHIKLHPELGHRILSDIRQLRDVLPVVLHHHEQWDGRGYPYGLKGEEIPLEARIVAVADAYDAMTSDRPYRKGMPVSRVEEIFRGGSGKQWDAEVIDAYFEARDEILQISSEERAGLQLDVNQWLSVE